MSSNVMTQNQDAVNPEAQPDFVKNLFGSISKTYDRANDVITLGMAQGWRRQLVRYTQAYAGQKVLDVATGTGDLALEFKKVVGPMGKVVGVDFCQEMLDFAPAKAKAMGLDVSFTCADAMALPFDDNEFDITSISYGLRNVEDPQKALVEMARVTRPGGLVAVLETGAHKSPILQAGIDFYFKFIMPRLGGWVSGQRSAYEYLHRTSSRFPSGAAFEEMADATGAFSYVQTKTVVGGASFIYLCKVE